MHGMLLLADMAPGPIEAGIVLILLAIVVLVVVVVGAPLFFRPRLVEPPPIVYFDGVCGLCNRAVDFLIRRDRRGVLRFAPLQGETAQARLGTRPDDAFDTIVLEHQGRRFDKSDAALRICGHLGGYLRVLSWARILPRFLRDPLYNLVASNRYAWFGKKESCRLPTAAERSRFLP